jgi:beta-RFAP synthase
MPAAHRSPPPGPCGRDQHHGRVERQVELAPLVARLELPREWRFLLIVPRGDSGMAGIDESAAFSRLPAVPLATTDQLLREATMHLLPAAATGDFLDFSKSLYRFGHRAGTCFATVQGGAFASQRTTRLVERLRTIGVEGVGQSSWGPTVFAIVPDSDIAMSLARRFEPRVVVSVARVGSGHRVELR